MIEQNQQSAVETSIINMTPAAADKVRELLGKKTTPALLYAFLSQVVVAPVSSTV